MPVFDMKQFTAEVKTSQSTGGFDKNSHEVTTGTIEGSNKLWFCKQMRDDESDVAEAEVLAQEFFRLIIPHQPETRLAKDDKGQSFVLSEAVPGYRNLPTREGVKFENGHYTGLGQALIVAMFLQEIDLKNGNIGLDARGRVIKIDGDNCFAQLFQYKNFHYDLSDNCILRLPYPNGFTFNWLDFIMHGSAQLGSSIVKPTSLCKSPRFRAEVNEALLKISLIISHNGYIEAFVKAHIPAPKDQEFIELIKKRGNVLTALALKDESFIAYNQSPVAELVKAELVKFLESFHHLESGGVDASPSTSDGRSTPTSADVDVVVSPSSSDGRSTPTSADVDVVVNPSSSDGRSTPTSADVDVVVNPSSSDGRSTPTSADVDVVVNPSSSDGRSTPTSADVDVVVSPSSSDGRGTPTSEYRDALCRIVPRVDDTPTSVTEQPKGAK